MKVHKPKLSGRPIVSSINTVTYFASKYLDHILQPIYKRISSYIESSQALVAFLDGWKVPNYRNCVILCADIDSLYPNIPLVEGLKYMVESITFHNSMMDKRLFDENDIEFISELMRFVLGNNYFTFGNLIFKQLNGTAMGTPAAVVFACLFLDSLERRVFKEHKIKSMCFKRYIDDIFAIFGTKEEAELFLQHFTTKLPTIKCSSYTISETEGVFLDLVIFKGPRFQNEAKFDTKIYQKPQNKYLYLTPNSFHPKAIFPAFIVSELNRYRLCCNSEDDFQKVKNEFFDRLIARGYETSMLNGLFTKWSSRDILLKKVKERL
jgi:hypothetical protein